MQTWTGSRKEPVGSFGNDSSFSHCDPTGLLHARDPVLVCDWISEVSALNGTVVADRTTACEELSSVKVEKLTKARRGLHAGCRAHSLWELHCPMTMRL